MRILIIEDDADTRNFLQERLTEKCFAVDTADNGVTGFKLAKANDYDIILLDYGLPSKNGFNVCRDIRNLTDQDKATTPIIMISVTHDMNKRVEGFNLGADDYIPKPFFFDELFARIQAILRRPRARQDSLFQLEDLVLDSNRQRVTRADRSVYLTKKEFALLEYLFKNKGSVVSRGDITEHVWDMNIDPLSNTIEMHIFNLRKKIGDTKKKTLIHSLPGRGYKIDLER